MLLRNLKMFNPYIKEILDWNLENNALTQEQYDELMQNEEEALEYCRKFTFEEE